MGEVYRAWDTKLERAVALKILPPRLVADPSRLERFAREAKSASALAHPNIVTIYEIGEAEVAGRSDEPSAAPSKLHYIAMELVDGSTLRDLVGDEKVTLKTLLGYLGQAADGVARAHQAGVVHRDLKPDNIMVTRDGFVKILDFGLAKLDATVDPGGELTSVATVQGGSTREGVVLGSVGYMSPEQVQGRVVDHRTDIFAFGCLLYEAATRRRPFGQDSSIEIMHRILREEPAPMEQINPEVPGALRRLVRRCMAKAPDQRHQSMKDLALELSDFVTEFDSLAPASSTDQSKVGASTAPGRKARGWRWLGAATVVLVLAAVFWLLLKGLSTEGDGSGASPTQQLRMRELTTTADIAQVALSPNGEYLAQARWRPRGTGLWVTHRATGSSVEVLAPEDNLDLPGVTFTRDGNYLVLVRNDPERNNYSSAYQIPVLGGEPRRLLFDIDSAPSFSPDGRRMTFLRGAPDVGLSYLMVADADGGNAEILAQAERPDWFELHEPSWSPDGSTILVVQEIQGGLAKTIAKVDAATGRVGRSPLGDDHVFEDINSVSWLPDGSAIVFTGRRDLENDQVWIVELKDGRPRQLTQGLSDFTGVTVTSDGRTIASRHTTTRSQIWLAPADRPNAVRPLTANPRDLVGEVAISADGSIYFQRRDHSGHHIWRTSLEGTPPTRLTRDDYWYGPEVSIDGSLLLARRRTKERAAMQLWRLDPETGDPIERLAEGATNAWRVAIAPDSSWIAVDVDDGDLWIYPLDGGEPRLVADNLNGGPFVSPDGNTIAFLRFRTHEGGPSTQYIELISPEGTPLGERPAGRVNSADGAYIGFNPAGDSLIAHRFVNGISNLWRVPIDGSDWSQLTDFDHGLQGYIHHVAFSPDGRWLVLSKGEYLSDAVLLEGFR